MTLSSDNEARAREVLGIHVPLIDYIEKTIASSFGRHPDMSGDQRKRLNHEEKRMVHYAAKALATDMLRLSCTPHTVDREAWQPIETAPKDSEARLVWVPDNQCIYAVAWRKGDAGDRTGWMIFGGGWRDMIQGATHWMPLPANPLSPSKQSDGHDV